MEPKSENFKVQLAFGQDGEHEVAQMLINKGIVIMPLYQFVADHAPYIITENMEKIVSPDLICFANNGAFMVEVKTKNQWVSFNNINETGIDARLYRHYLQIKTATKTNVWLFFNHKTSGETGIFYVQLEKYTRHWDGKVKGVQKHPEMYFYDRSVLLKME
jgi:hypothetical protein